MTEPMNRSDLLVLRKYRERKILHLSDMHMITHLRRFGYIQPVPHMFETINGRLIPYMIATPLGESILDRERYKLIPLVGRLFK